MGGYKYLLVFIDTFSGWVEAFPTRKETALVVTKNYYKKSSLDLVSLEL